jgi:hypothetical protein
MRQKTKNHRNQGSHGNFFFLNQSPSSRKAKNESKIFSCLGTFKATRNRFQGVDSANLCSLAGIRQMGLSNRPARLGIDYDGLLIRFTNMGFLIPDG